MTKYQRGFVMVSAIFLLVVIAALGLFSVTISTSQQQNAAMDALGSRAYQAAKAGIELSIYQIINDTTIRNACQGASYAAPATLSTLPALPSGTQLSAFTVTVTCGTSGAQITDGNSTFWLYQLTSIAATGVVGTPGYYERQIQTTITN